MCTLFLPLFTLDHIWIVGDSIFRRAEGRLDITVNIFWHRKGGAGVADLYDMRAELGKVLPLPAMLIIHFGSNDLVRLDEYALRQRVSVMLQDCATWCPTMTIVWSDFLPRVFYFGAFLQPAVERKRRTINRWARSQCTKIPNALCLHHPQF